jgi:hypothetical protein
MRRSRRARLSPSAPWRRDYGGRLFVAESRSCKFIHAVSVWAVGERLLSLPFLSYLMLAAEE